MRTLNLSGIKPGDSLNISVSQGAITAGPVNVPAWGSAGGDGGTIRIVVERTQMQVAPDTVRFTVDLSNASFDTQGPGAGEVYDARLHDLIFLWDLKDTAPDWTKPINVLAAWKDRSVAKGPFVQHMYSQPGDYEPSVLVIEPSSGKTATASLSGVDKITVLSPDDVYTGTDTICVSPVGDTDPLPAHLSGANRVYTDHFIYTDPYWAAAKFGNAKRWLFKCGAEFKCRTRLDSQVTDGVYFGAYGTGARPVLKWDGFQAQSDSELKEMNCFSLEQYGINKVGGGADIRFVGLEFKGGLDTITTRSDYGTLRYTAMVEQPAIRSLADVCGMVSDCAFDGQQSTSINFQGSDDTKEQSWHLDDCSVTSFGGQYAIFGLESTHNRSSLSVTGCLLAQPVGSMGPGLAEAQGSSRAILRSSNPHRFHMRCNDSYHTDFNQHHYVPYKNAIEHGGIVNVHSCSMEGGIGGINLWADYANPGKFESGNSIVFNAIIDGCFYFCNYSSEAPFYSNGSGVTFRNLHCVQPSISRVKTNNRCMFEINSRGTFDATLVGSAPIKIYNCTYIYLKTDGQNIGTVQDPNVLRYLKDATLDLTVIEENNILHKPNAGPRATKVETFTPLTEAVLFAHRSTGFWTSDPEFAIERNSSRTLAPGASYTIPYGVAYGYIPVDQSNFLGSNGKERLYIGASDKQYLVADGTLEVTYGATEISIKNTSSDTWNAAGGYWGMQLDMGTTAPIGTDTVPPAGSWKDYRPDTGSAALGAALNGEVSYMDITLQDRPEPPSMGAWEAE